MSILYSFVSSAKSKVEYKECKDCVKSFPMCANNVKFLVIDMRTKQQISNLILLSHFIRALVSIGA